MFIDTHAHLYNERFDGMLDEIVKYASDMNVKKIICSASDIETAYKAIAVAEKYEGVYATIGVHPQDAGRVEKDYLKTLEKLAENKKVVGIGEIGLEYMEGCPDKNVQKKVFLEQLFLAHKLKLPIVIHCRNAVGDMLELLQENKNLLEYGGTFHCFSESLESARLVLALGLHISVGGVVTFKNGRKLQEVVPFVPLDRLLLETDCPYLAPEPNRGKLNQPAYIPLIAEKIASLKGIEVSDVAKHTTENARRLFGL